MIKHIYVIGDSFSFGQELGGPIDKKDFFKFTPYMKEHSYTGIIVREWGVEGYTNTSCPGGSNDRIHRMIFTDLPTLFTHNRPEEVFVFISITHASRTEFFDKRLGKFSPFISNWAPPKENKAVYSLWENYILNFDDPKEQAMRYVSQILSIQSFLKNLGIDYLMTRSMGEDEIFKGHYNALPIEILSLIDKKHFPDIVPFNSFARILKLPFGPEQHPLEEGHRAWAKYLMEYMQQNKIGVI